MFFRKCVFISLICGVLTSCGYEGQEECEVHFKNQTYKYKEACNCLREKAENNGVKNFKNFIMVVSNENSRKDLMRMAMASVFGSKSIGTETETYLKTLTDAGSFCRLRDPDIDRCIVCGDTYISTYDGVNLMLKDKDREYLKKDGIEKYLFKGNNFVDVVELVGEKTKHPFFTNYVSINKEKAIDLDKEIPFEYRGILFLAFNDEFCKVYNYFRKYQKYEKQDAADQAYASALSVMNNLTGTEKGYLDNYLKTRMEVYQADEDYQGIGTEKYAKMINKLVEKTKAEKEQK